MISLSSYDSVAIKGMTFANDIARGGQRLALQQPPLLYECVWVNGWLRGKCKVALGYQSGAKAQSIYHLKTI